MELKRVEITELQGINRNAVEGVTQTQPTEVKGFEFGRAGGYYAYYDSDTSNALVSGINGSVISYDLTGLALFDDNKFLHENTLDNLAATSVNTLNQYLLPTTGVTGNPSVTGADEYELGAFVKDLASNQFRDLPRASGITISTGGSAGTIDETLDHRILVFLSAPTPAGFVVYQSLVDDLPAASISANETITVTLDDVLPRGYEMRAYLSDGFGGGGNPSKFLPEETGSSRTAYSDGSSVARSTNSGSAFDTAFNGATEFGVRADLAQYPGESYYYSFPIYFPNGLTLVSRTSYLYFSKRLNNSGNVQFGVGFQCTVLGRGDGNNITFIVAPFIEVNNVKQIVSPNSAKTFASTGSTTISGVVHYRYNVDISFLKPRIEFYVDLSGSSYTIYQKDLNDNILNTYSGSLSGLASSLYNTGVTSTPVEIFAFDPDAMSEYEAFSSTLPSSSNVWTTVEYQRQFALYDVEVHDTASTGTFSGGTSVAILDADDWNGATSTITDTVTSVEWEDYKEFDTSTQSYVGNGKQLIQNPSPELQLVNPNKTVLYSDIGYANFNSSYSAFLEFQFLSSEEVTALASTPAGLLVFGENETFLVRGDPTLADTGNFSSQRLSGVIGCDAGKRPARLGGIVFVIYRGRLYGINLGMGDVDFGSGIEDVGAPIYDPEDPFVQVIGDPNSRHVIARTQLNNIYRFSTITNSWMTDVFTGENVNTLIPSIDSDGARYLISSSVYSVTTNASGITPTVAWSDVDLGDKGLTKAWRRVRVYTGDNYSGTPTLEYRVNPDDVSTSTVTATEEGDGWWVFTFPSGIAAPKMDLMRVSMPNANFGDVFEPPVVVEFAERYRRR